MYSNMIPYVLLALIPSFVAMSVIALLARSRRVAFALSTAMLAAMSALSLYLLVSGAGVTILGAFHMYAFSLLFATVFPVLLLLVNVLAFGYSKNYPEHLLMLGLVLAGSLVVTFAASLLEIVLGIELVTIPACFMMLLGGRRRAEPAVKLFIMGALAAGALVFAVTLAFPYDAQLALAPLVSNAALPGSFLPLLALLLIFSALAVEAALFPFNMWIPDVYEGAQSFVTAMLSGVNENVAFVALAEVLFLVFAAYASKFSALAVMLSVATMFFGNLIALAQKSVKRMLAYSSISQAGYILIGFAAATSSGIAASVFQMVAHSFTTLGVFAIVLLLEANNIRTIDDYAGLHGRSPFIALALTVLMLSLAGVPPLMGFYGKFLLFSSAIGAGMLALALIGVLNSFISIFYYGRVISAMYSTRGRKHIRAGPYVAAVVLVALAAVIVLGIYPQPIIALAKTAGAAITGM